jgi:sodium-dependent dicarboxylate transporter 2/3/5
MIALAENLGLDPLSIALPASITASLAFILVTSSPTNVIPYSAGYFSIRDFAKSGIIMTLVTTLIVSLVIYVVGRASGLY